MAQAAEYAGFDAQVRRPGAAFLAQCPQPNSNQFKRKNLWSRAAKQLHSAYNGLCAYTAMYLSEQGSVDHFLPKESYPTLAYEWSNFRLAGGRINNSKGNQVGIIDPFEVQDDWFFLDLPSCIIKANPQLDKTLRARISSTINCLKLNSDDFYVQERCDILVEYAKQEIGAGFLVRRYPFLHKEIVRQDMDDVALRSIFKL